MSSKYNIYYRRKLFRYAAAVMYNIGFDIYKKKKKHPLA